MNFNVIWKHFDFDLVGQHKIRKSIELYHKGGPLKSIYKFRSLLMWNHIRKYYNCDIFPGIIVGDNLRVVHCISITIGKTSIIGDNCKVYARVAVVAKGVGDNPADKSIRRHALIGDNCILGDGCTLIGPISIGDDCIIGARAIVTQDVPAHSVVKGLNEIRAKRTEELGYH